MGINKNKLKKRKLASKKKKIRRKEQEDATGVIRKKRNDKPELNPLIFYSIKGVLLLLICISYFTFSFLLLPLFSLYISLYYFSFWVERKINRNYNVENKKKILKLDSAIAFITVIVSISSTIFSTIRMSGKGRNGLTIFINKIFSLSTGIRSTNQKNFGMGERPEGFVPPSGSTGGRPTRPDFDIGDLPIEFAFTQILSTIIQLLILFVVTLGVISTTHYFYNKYIKSKKMRIKENNKNQWVFSKEDLKRILEENV